MSGTPEHQDEARRREREAERKRREQTDRPWKDDADKEDEVDEALEETFPASDPPAHSRPRSH